MLSLETWKLDYGHDEIDDAEDELHEAEANESEWNDRQADLEEADELDHRVAEHYKRFYRAANQRDEAFDFDQEDPNRDEPDDDDDIHTAMPDDQGQVEADQDLGDCVDTPGVTILSKEESDEDEPYCTASQPRTPDQLIEDLERYVAAERSSPLDQEVEDEITAHVVQPAGYSDRNDDAEEKNFDVALPVIAYPTAFDDQPTPAGRHRLQSRRSWDPEIPSCKTTASQTTGQHDIPQTFPHRRTSWSDFLRPSKSPPAGTAITTAHTIHAIGLGPYGSLGQETRVPFNTATSRPEPIRTEQTVRSDNGTFSLVWEENPGTDDDADAALPELFDYVETPSYINPRDLEDIVQQISNPPSRSTSGVFGALPAKTRLAAWSWIAEQQKKGDEEVEEEEASVEREEDPPGPPNTLRSGPSSAGHSMPHSPVIEKDSAGLVEAGVDELDDEDADENDDDVEDQCTDDPAQTLEQDQDPDPLALSTSAFSPDRQRSYSMPTTTTTKPKTHGLNLHLHLPTRPDSPYLPHPLSNLSAPEQETFSSHRDSFLLAKQKYQKRPVRRSTGPLRGSALSNKIGRGRGRSGADSANNPTSASPGPGPTIGLTPASTWTEEASEKTEFRRGSTGSFGIAGPEIPLPHPHQQQQR
ncbi:hypothetical protein LTR86_002632 [Recurvomyces mirabilis]|nr:hypothetical protein LTR86_002632 [Recurvomyces mirabilis]